MNLMYRSLLLSAMIHQITIPLTFTVTNTNNSGAGSLRQAILDNNANPGPNNINFNIPGAGPHTISPATDLDRITNTVTIDGYTQPGASANNQFFGDDADIRIIINGSNYTVGDGISTGNGLTFGEGSSGSVVKGLCINEWIDCGILIDGAVEALSNISIVGNFIGTNVSGTQVLANRVGIGVSGDSTGVGPVSGTRIGSALLADRNVIAGSWGFAIIDDYLLRGACISLFDHLDTVIYGNFVGIDVSGANAFGDSQQGIYDRLGENTIIGGAGITQRNYVSGHLMYGMRLRDLLNGIVENNYVGTNVQGNAIFEAVTQNQGIYLDGETTGTIVRNNLVSGNVSGIVIGSPFGLLGAESNIFVGNLVGTDASGTLALGNRGDGIIVNTPNNTIGDLGSTNKNVISNNGNNGITVSVATNTTIQNNYIGVDLIGDKPRGNGNHGIQVGLQGGLAGASDNLII